MRTLLLHLSDFHFRASGDNPAIFRAREIAQAALGNVPGVSRVIVVATGDFVDKGDTDAFQFASLFLDDLRVSVCAFAKGIEYVGEVLVPGNHDVVKPSKSNDGFARTKALEDVAQHARTFGASDPAVAVLLANLEPFFEFEASRTKRVAGSDQERLAWKVSFALGADSIEIVVVNTGWTSDGLDDQGRMLATLPDLDGGADSALHIVALHLSLPNRLHRDNVRPVHKAVASYADLVLSGHEHQGQDFVRHGVSTSETVYFEGDALGVAGEASGFAALAIDFMKNERKTLVFGWDGQKYVVRKQADWKPLRRGVGGASDGFVLTEEFEEVLDEPGLAASREAERIRLEDVFVYPRLRDVTVTRAPAAVDKGSAAHGASPREAVKHGASRPSTPISKGATPEPIVGAAEALSRMESEARMLIVGDGRCGKTALLRKYYRDLRRMGLVPLWIKPQDLRAKNVDQLFTAMRKRAIEQYGPKGGERFVQLPLSKRVIICDDLEAVDLSSDGLRQAFNNLEEVAAKTILAGDELFILRQLWASFGIGRVFDYKVYTILELDPSQQREFVYKLSQSLNLSNDPDTSGDELGRLERNLTSILGEQTVTAYPGDVKLILTDLIQQQHDGAEYGAYGFFYDRLIKNDIASGMKSLNKEALQLQADMILQFLSDLAIYMHGGGKTEVSKNEMSGLIRVLHEQGHNVNGSLLVTALLKSRMLIAVGDAYRFRERYQRYFFLGIASKRYDG